MEDSKVTCDDEINLRDLLLVIFRYWKIIIGFFLVAVIITGILSFFVLHPVYEVDAEVSLGYLSPAGTNPIQPLYTNPDYAKQLLSSDEFLMEVVNQLHLVSYASPNMFQKLKKSININTIANTNMLQLSIDTKHPDEGKAILTEMLDIYSNNSSYELDRQVNLISSEIQRINLDITNNEQTINSTENTYSSLDGKSLSIDAEIQRSELLDTLSRFEDQRQGLLEEKIARQQELNGIEQMRIIQTPSYSPIPISPHKLQNIAISGILGLMVGIFVAFVLDYYRRNLVL